MGDSKVEVDKEILSAIPQREPFLFVDRVVERKENWIHTQKQLTGTEDFFQGHFPGNPIMPGVLQCEAIFQTGAVLMGGKKTTDNQVGVVTRVAGTKFKNFVKPGDLMDMEVELIDQVANAFVMKGKIKVNNKLAMSTEFTCALVETPQ